MDPATIAHLFATASFVSAAGHIRLCGVDKTCHIDFHNVVD